MERLKKLINTELISEVLGKQVDDDFELDLSNEDPILSFSYKETPNQYMAINLYEFADKCKKLAINKYHYNINSGYVISASGDIVSYGNAFNVDTESEDFTCFNKEEIVSIIECFRYIYRRVKNTD